MLASIRKSGLEIKNRCTECLWNQGFIHEIGQYRGWDWAEAGTGRHGGGITLSKKPPEWRLSRRTTTPAAPRQQTSPAPRWEMSKR